MSETFGPIYERNQYAGFMRRTLALLLDLVICIALWITLGIAGLWLSDDRLSEGQFERWLAAGFPVLLVAYNIGFRLSMKGTPGYRIVGIRYAYMLDGQPPWTMIVFRAVVAVFLLAFFALDHLWILFDERKQAWHDKLSGFYVVKRRAQPVGSQRIIRRVINFMMLSLVVFEPERTDARDAITTR